MLKYILIILLVVFLFRAVRRFLFFHSHNAFQNAAEDFMKKKQKANERKPHGKVTIEDLSGESRSSRNQEGEYVDYEEIK